MGLAKFVLRTTVGGTIMAHGLQKLNGGGVGATEKTMKSLGLHPPKYQAWAAALSETVGGALTAAGLLSPLGPSMIIGSQAVALNKVHQKNGFWAHKGGYEYNVTLMTAAFALAEMGPGGFSLDRLFGKRRSGFGWAFASAALALGAAAATLQFAQRFAPEETESDGAAANPTDEGAESADLVTRGTSRGSDDRQYSADEGSGGTSTAKSSPGSATPTPPPAWGGESRD